MNLCLDCWCFSYFFNDFFVILDWSWSKQQLTLIIRIKNCIRCIFLFINKRPQIAIEQFYIDKICVKLMFWEGNKILRNLHLNFVYSTYRHKLGGDFANFCGLLRIYKLYQQWCTLNCQTSKRIIYLLELGRPHSN